MTDQPIVYVVDDDPSVQKASSRLFRSAGFKVVTFASADEFLEYPLESGVPGCVILDYQMPGRNGIETQEELAARDSMLPIVFMTGHGNVPTSVNAMKKGAVNFLTKPVDAETLAATVQQAIEQHTQALKAESELQQFRQGVASLTKREREVMLLVVTGMLNKQIARKLGITEATVKVHRGRMMEKIGVDSVAELAVCCERAGSTPSPDSASEQRSSPDH